MVKGITKIELFKAKKKIKETLDENIITKLIQNKINLENLMINSPLGLNCRSSINMTSSSKPYLSLINGILLFEDKIVPDANYLHHNKRSVASAGSKYDMSDGLRGSLNEQETGETTIDGKAAYRYVWDFGTANANCTFNSICLTTLQGGNRTPFIRQGGGVTTANHGMRSHPTKYPWVLTDSGKIFIIKDNTLQSTKFKEDFSLKDKFSSVIVYTPHDLLGIIELANTILIENGELIVVGKKGIDNKWFILWLNPDDMSVVKEEELVGITSIAGFKKHFAFLDTDGFVFDWQAHYTNHSFKYYNRKTKLIDAERYYTANTLSDVNCDNGYVNDHPYGIQNIKSGDNYFIQFMTKGNHWVYGGFIYNKNIPVHIQTYGKYEACAHLVSSDLRDNVFMSDDSQVREVSVGGIEPLFTINALDAPVTKTEANTMKITYTLIFD